MTTTTNDQSDQPHSSNIAASSAAPDVKDDSKADTKADTKDKNNDDDGGPYTPSSILSCSPLVQLQAYGLCCPFLETEEEHDARVGAHHLQNYPITWYRKKSLEDVAHEVTRVVGGGTTTTAAGGSKLMDGIGQLFGSRTVKQKIPMSYVGVPAILSVVDTDNHGPIMELRSLDASHPSHGSVVNEYLTGGKPWWEDASLRNKSPSKVVPLYMVDKVSHGWSISGDSTAGGVKLYAAPSKKGFLVSGVGSELLRFDTLGGGGNTMMDRPSPEEPNKHSDKVILQLNSLLAWNRRRIARGVKKGTVEVAPKSTSPGYVAMT
mmetsp:Transcript_21937/g.39570  ORF Transcript_21937/g.39570 Transcript_21937/m.39570 type:complete len:320 (-) Transcript_21937:423-1382(-)